MTAEPVRTHRRHLTNTDNGEAIKINARLSTLRFPQVLSAELAQTALGIIEARSTLDLPRHTFVGPVTRAHLAVQVVRRGTRLSDLEELADQLTND